MFSETIFFLFLGILLGLVTGLIPGLHPNTVFIILFSLLLFFPTIPVHYLLVFTVSLSISNTFTDFIPTILFGAPEPDSCLSILPSHKLLFQGRGYEALFLTVIGGLGVCVLILITLPFLLFLIPALYHFLYPFLYLVLISIVIWMIKDEEKKINAVLSFFLSGVLGVISLKSLPSTQVIFPALSGLFGMSALLITIKTKPKIPTQTFTLTEESHKKGVFTGWLAGMFAGMLPGIGSAQAGVLASQILKAKTKEFITALGGINTANMFFTFIVFYTIHKTRSGAVWFISQIFPLLTSELFILILLTATISCLLSSIITLKIGRFLLKKAYTINYFRLNFITSSLLFILVFIFTGITGVFIFILGTFIGLFTILSGIKRTHMMGFLLFPTILYLSGIT